MTKRDLIEAVAKAAQINKGAAGEAVDATFDGIAKAIKKSKRFQVPGFGTFTVRARKARTVRNPQTGAAITVKASRTVGFKPAPDLKKGVMTFPVIRRRPPRDTGWPFFILLDADDLGT